MRKLNEHGPGVSCSRTCRNSSPRQPVLPRDLLHPIEMRDHRQHSAHARLSVLQRIMKMTPRMRPAADLHQSALRVGEKAVVNDIGIGPGAGALEIFQKFFRPGTFPGVGGSRRSQPDDPGLPTYGQIRPFRVCGRFRSRTFTGVSSVPTTFEAQHKVFQAEIKRDPADRRIVHPSIRTWSGHLVRRRSAGRSSPAGGARK